MTELDKLRVRWADAVSENFDVASAAWRVTEDFEQATFDDAKRELKYMRDLLAKFDDLIGA